jgi:hypothetical protein
MSLHTLANHLQSAGRGEDKVLVHMTPGEVGGLQSLALAHGGSLTINPQTGLPEASFLRSLLPMIAGFALGPAGFKLMSAAQAGLAVGAATGLATGSLKQGLMAGLGAYGGAGLGQGLMAQGAQGAGAGAAGAIDDVANMQKGNVLGGVQPPTTPLFGQPAVNTAATPNMGYAAYTPPPPVAPTYAQTQANMLESPMFQAKPPAPSAVTTPTSPVTSSTYSPSNFNAGQNLSGTGAGPRRSIELKEDIIRPYVEPPAAAPAPAPPPAPTRVPIEVRTPTPLKSELLPGGPPVADPQSITGPFRDRMSQVGRGFEASTKDFEGLKGLYNAMPQYSVAASGLTLADAMKPKPINVKKDKALIRPYEFTYGATGVDQEPYMGSGERLYFNPQFTALDPYEAPGPEYAANGGLMGYAVGGPVEQMSAMNSVGSNTGYPMANINTPAYSNPMMQRPEATNLIAPYADVGVGAYSGEPRFARGGATKEPETTGGYKYAYDPKTMKFTQLSSPTPTPTTPSVNLNNGPAFMGPVGSTTPYGLGGYTDFLRNSPRAQATPTPTPTDGTVTGGIEAPVVQPTNPAQSLIPNINIPAYQTPEQQLGLEGFYNYMNQQLAGYGGYATGGKVGGISHLGGYSDGGRLLRGPGDGVSDSIPASIGNRQPARLADGEFVVPARIVSEIGNGSTEAGARKLYAMMDRVQRARRKTVGKGQVARNTKAEKLLPA